MTPPGHNHRFTTVWFDLDATLYDPETGLWAQIGRRIEDYLKTVMGFPPDKLREIKLDYYLRYGTTLRGLQLHNLVDTHDYLKYVHDIPVSDYLQPDPSLRDMLRELPLRRIVFTNSDRAHTLRVLRALGIEDCFSDLITVESIQFQCKPNPEAFQAALALSGTPNFSDIVFLEDSTRNLEAARKLGIFSVLVGSTDPHPAADLCIARPHDLRTAMPGLFQNGSWPAG